MITIKCIHTSLVELPPGPTRGIWAQSVIPIDLDFGLVRNALYDLFELSLHAGMLRVYARERDGSRILSSYPAVLFDLQWTQLDGAYSLIMLPEENTLRVVLAPLAKHPDWFERFCEDDPSILQLVEFAGQHT